MITATQTLVDGKSLDDPPSGGRVSVASVVFPILAAACLIPYVEPWAALAGGMIVALTLGNPFSSLTKRASKILLQCCVVGLGFGMNLTVVLKAGRDGMVFAAATIAGTFLAGWVIAKLLQINSKLSALVSSGTAICGGSAIAAVGSVIAAGDGEMTVAIGTVFLLNAVALFIFPPLGHILHLTQNQFGTWAGVAIHDVSSVVGAATAYGGDALNVATAVKLSRALWIVPVTLIAAAMFHRMHPEIPLDHPDGSTSPKKAKAQIPWFIGLFLLASVISTYVPAVAHHAHLIKRVATQGLSLTLFLIGAGLSRKALKAVGWQPLAQGIALWLLISTASLAVIKFTIR